jgi:hypothetical protein
MSPALVCDLVGKFVIHVLDDQAAYDILGYDTSITKGRGHFTSPFVEIYEPYEEIVIEGEMLDSVDDAVLERFDLEILGEGPEVDQISGPPSRIGGVR